MKLKSSHIGLGAAALVLLAGLIFQGVRMRDVQRGDVTSEARPIGLATLMPFSLDGWTVRDEPLGPSEFLQDAVARNLNYDDYVYRIYQRGGRSFGVYVAYWSPGRMPVQKIASHTPDRCWTENGWRCEEMRFSESVSLPQTAELKPAQWRKFVSPHGVLQHVLYWHLVGDELYAYGDRFNASPDPLKWWRDTIAYAFQGSQEQYFIRLTSDRPFEELKEDPGFRGVVEALGKLGLAERSPPAS